MLEKFFIRRDSFRIDWDYVNTIPEFKQLASCQQNPKWHGEGDALQHTLRCLDAAYDHVNLYYDALWDKRRAVLAVLFHDIGKTKTTEFFKGAWHAYNHEFVGERITRRILWDADIFFRENICASVRYHMDVLRVADSTNDILKRLITPTYNKYFRWKDVLFVKLCDVHGSVPEDEQETQIGISKVTTLENITNALGIYDRYQGWQLPHDLYVPAVRGKRNVWLRSLDPKLPKVYVMIGLPGSGKNTWIDNYFSDRPKDSYVVVSRDDIRAELGYCNEGDKVVLSPDKEAEVSKVFDERFIKALHEGKDVVLNNINLKKQYRDNYKSLGYIVEWIYVYIEAKDMETLLHRRQTIPFNVYESMIDKFEFPQPGEYDDIIISKQSR